MKTENICECGHEKWGVHRGGNGECSVYACPCKKFKEDMFLTLKNKFNPKKPQNQARQDSVNMHGSKEQDVRWNSEPTAENIIRHPSSLKNVQLCRDALRGIFDVADLEKEFKMAQGTEHYCFVVKGKLKERQRLKAEVEKILDEFVKESNNEFFDNNYEELKKRLGI